MKKILFIFSQYRVGERIFPVVEKLDGYELHCLLVYEMNSRHKWPGDFDLRKVFFEKYKKFFTKISESINDLNYQEYHLIVADDNRHTTKTNLKTIYDRKKCNMLACYHGPVEKYNNLDFFKIGYKTIYDTTLVLGKKDCLTDYCKPIGIPSNDILENKKVRPNHILVIVNFLGNIKSVIGHKPFSVTFDEDLVKKIDFERIQRKLKVPIVIKLKSRAGEGDNQVERNTNYIKSIMPNVDFSVLTDADNDYLIENSKFVISSPGTFAFKSIQMGIPTILIEGSNESGHFGLYKGFVKSDKDLIKKKIDEMMSFGKDEKFIREVIEGGEDFTSTDKMIEIMENNL